MDQHDLSVEFRPSLSPSAPSFSPNLSVSTSAITIGTSLGSGPLTRPGVVRSQPSAPQSLSHQTQRVFSMASHLSTMADQRRHTVDFSNWSSTGLTFENIAPMHQSRQQQQHQLQQQLQQQQQQQQSPPSTASHCEGQDQVQSPCHGSSPSTWDRHSPRWVAASPQHDVLSSISVSPSGPGGEGQGVRTHLRLPPQHPSQSRPGNNHLHPTGNVTSDSVTRRASMSHLPLCNSSGGGGGGGGDGNGIWDQSTTLPRTLYDTVSFLVPSAAWDPAIAAGDRGLSDEHRDSSFKTFQSEGPYGNEGDMHQKLPSQHPTTYPSSTLTSSGRNSRILPNPIQPPVALKMSTDDHSLQGRDASYLRFDQSSLDQSMQKHRQIFHPSQRPFNASTSTSLTSFSDLSRSEEDDTTITASSSLSSLSTMSSQGTVQHGGFVPGFDLWMSGSEKMKNMIPSSSSFSGLNLMGQQRRNSESVIQDFVPSPDLDFLSKASIYRLSNTGGASASTSAAAAVATSVSSQTSSASTRSTSPLDGFGGGGSGGSGLGYQQQNAGSGALFHDVRDGQEMRRDHSLTSLEEEFDFRSTGTAGQRPGDGNRLLSLHPHFSPMAVNEFNVDLTASGYVMCGLCGVQPSTVPLGTCGHRICNVCHRHEKHRSMRLFQNAIPPCPFCAHGIIPTDNNPGAEVHLSRSHLVPSNMDISHRQQRHLSLPPPARQQQQRLPLPLSATQHRRSSEGFMQDDFVDGVHHYSRQYPPTFQAYGTGSSVSSAQDVERSPSLHMDPALSMGSNGLNSSYTQQRASSGYFYPVLQQQQHRSSMNQFGTKYQSSPLAVVSMTDRDSMGSKEDYRISNMVTGGAQTMTGPSTSYWHDPRASGGLNAINSMSLAEHLHESTPNIDTIYPAARRASIAYDSSRSTTPTIYYSGAGSTPPVSEATLLSFPTMPNLPSFAPPTAPRTEVFQWAVVRVTNIPWDVSLQDLQGFLAGFPVPPEHLLSQNVHILMDRATGKTFNSAFVELALSSHQARKVAQTRNLKVLKGRLVTVELSSQDELMRSIFPKWTGEFQDGEPVLRSESSGDTIISSRAESGMTSTTPSMTSTVVSTTPPLTPPFVTREEINALLVVCRNYKLHFSRKCAERPFENILSILAKYPWHQPHRVPPLHRDHIFELLKLSIESLRMHLGKEYNTIHPTLLVRMVRCAILTPAFTERQKAMVLQVAGMTSCPEDLVGWMTPIIVQATELSATPSSATTTALTDTIQRKDTSATGFVNRSTMEGKSQESRKLESEIEALDIKETSACHEDSPSDFPALPSSESPATAAKDPVLGAQNVSWAAVAAPCPTAALPVLVIQTDQRTSATATSTGSPAATSPSYAAAVIQPAQLSPVASNLSADKPETSISCKSAKALNTSTSSQRPGMASISSASSSRIWKPMSHAQHHRHHHSGRSLSVSGFSSFTSSSMVTTSHAVMPRLPLGAISYAFPSLTSGLQKLDDCQGLTDRKTSSIFSVPATELSLQSTSSFPSSSSSPTLHHSNEAWDGVDGGGRAVGVVATSVISSKGRLNFRQRSGSLPRLNLPLIMLKATSTVPPSPATSIATSTTMTPSLDAWSRSSSLSSSSSISSPGGGFASLSGLSAVSEKGSGGTLQQPTTTFLSDMSSRPTSESILDAIKTITQSTPRLTKSTCGSNNTVLAVNNYHLNYSGSKRD